MPDSENAKREVWVTKKEIMMPRTAGEFFVWVEEKIAAIGSSQQGLTALRLRIGLAKQLMEELFPLAIFVQEKYGNSGSVWIEPVIRDQNFDAILRGNGPSNPATPELFCAFSSVRNVIMPSNPGTPCSYYSIRIWLYSPNTRYV
jgi:hypothetical protein